MYIMYVSTHMQIKKNIHHIDVYLCVRMSLYIIYEDK